MRATRIPADEQFRLIMECRTSGLTNHEWCLQNDIKPGTFYNWVRRFQQKGYTEIPDAIDGHVPCRQEVAKIELTPPATNESVVSVAQNQGTLSMQGRVMELSIAGTVLQIPNGRDPVLLGQTLHILKELSC